MRIYLDLKDVDKGKILGLAEGLLNSQKILKTKKINSRGKKDK
jgi:hypothetical protein